MGRYMLGIFVSFGSRETTLFRAASVAEWFASFITHSDVGLFSLLFVVQLGILLFLFLAKLPKLNYELNAWVILSIVSITLFALYPTDQPRLFTFFLWLIPVFLLYECWDRNWELTAVIFVIWQILIFGAIPFSPQGWIIDGASSHLTNVTGIVRPSPDLWFAFSIVGIIGCAIFWIVLTNFVFNKKMEE